LNSDIRRVSVDPNGFNFEALKLTIRRLFKTLSDEELVALDVRYQDDESDWITVSSDEELEEALSLLPAESPRVLRLSMVQRQNSPFRHGFRHGGWQQRCGRHHQKQGAGWNRWCGGRAKFFSLQQQGLKLMEEGSRASLETARANFQEQLAIFENAPTPLYNVACCEALLGNAKEALAFLEKAINAGFRNVKHMESDTDLDSLRSLPEYQALISSLKSSRGSSPWAPASAPVAPSAPAPAPVTAPLRVSLPSLVAFAPASAPVAPSVPAPAPVQAPAPAPAPVQAPAPAPAPAPAQAPAPVAPSENGWNIKILEDMGFTNTKKNIEVLIRTKGDVMKAIQILLDETLSASWH